MSFVNLGDISIAYGGRDILSGISLNLSKDSRIALSGANGSGKSTLLKVAAGIIKPDSGTLSVHKETRISYLPQSGIVFKGVTLYSEAEKAFSVFRHMTERMKQIEHNLSSADRESPGSLKLLEEHHEIHEKILSARYYDREKEIESVLKGLGFSQSDFTGMTDEFSGGWQMRIALAVILLEKPDIILLDEPTNYLDIEARDWLEDYINRFPGGVVIVSHDKYFLDITCREIIELFDGKINRYRGNYSAYETVREKELETLVKQYKKQQDDIEKTESFIRKFRFNSSKAQLVQSRIKYLENMDLIEIPESLKKMHFHFPPPPHSGKEVITAVNLSREYKDFKALKSLSFNVRKGEKIALAGKNGAGKSTLLRILAGADTEYSGELKYGKDVKTGYFSQDFETTLSESNTVFEEIESVSKPEQYPLLRNLLGAFLFRDDDIYKKVECLSGGEKNRIALLKLLLNPVNLLVLDEPTNHLDINSKDILLEALQNYTGTLIFVSHDRYFIERLAARVIELDSGIMNDYPGDYEYYIWKKSTAEENSEVKGDSVSKDRSDVKKKETRLAENESRKERRKLEKRSLELIELLDKLSEEEKSIEHSMSLEENYTRGDKIRELKEKLNSNSKLQEQYTAEWEAAEYKLLENCS